MKFWPSKEEPQEIWDNDRAASKVPLAGRWEVRDTRTLETVTTFPLRVPQSVVEDCVAGKRAR